MSDFLKILTHKKRLGAQLKNVDLETIDEVRQKLDDIYQERKEEQREVELEAEKKREKIELLKQKAEELNISLTDLIPGGVESTPKAKKKKPAKYEVKLASGGTKTWTGQGRMPNEIKNAIDSGTRLEDLLIDKSD